MKNAPLRTLSNLLAAAAALLLFASGAMSAENGIDRSRIKELMEKRYAGGQEKKDAQDELRRLGDDAREILVEMIEDPSVSDKDLENAAEHLLAVFPSRESEAALVAQAMSRMNPAQREMIFAQIQKHKGASSKPPKLPPLLHVLLFILLPVVQIGFAAHAFFTDQSLWWVAANLGVPIVGPALYFHLILLRDIRSWMRTRSERKPSLGRLKSNFEFSDSVENREALADGYRRAGLLDESIKLYRESLAGFYQDDVPLLFGLARALLDKGVFEEARGVFARIGKKDPQFHRLERLLSQGKALEALGDLEGAFKEYGEAQKESQDPEAACRAAAVLGKMGREMEARALCESVVLWGRNVSSRQRKAAISWIRLAEKTLGGLKA